MVVPRRRTLKEVRNELAEVTAEHLTRLKTATYIPMSKQQMFEHGNRLGRIRKLSDEYLDLLREVV
jgi:hypothetical protein